VPRARLRVSMQSKMRGGPYRQVAWWGVWIALLAACSGELTGDGDPSGGGSGGEPGLAGTPGSGGNQGGSSGSGGIIGGAGGSTGGAAGTNTGGTGGDTPGSGGAGGNVAPPPGTIPMFLAQGEAGRTLVSCDDGRSWVADQSDHDGNYCDSHDCDHHPGAGRGLASAEGWFFATFGWGDPGAILRSRDGVVWESVLEGEVFGGIAYGNDRILAAQRYSRYSDDLGETWPKAGEASISGRNVRATAFVPHDGGLFIISASSSTTSEIVYSRDGLSWQAPETLPESCASSVRLPGRIIYGNGTIVTTGEDGTICRSSDGGRNWTAKSISSRLRGGGIWNGSEFMTWDRGSVFRSADGVQWTETSTVPSDVDVGVVAISDRGTIASITAGSKQEYEGQLAYRSEDGIHWEVLSGDAFSQGHPMRAMIFGYGEPSQYCP